MTAHLSVRLAWHDRAWDGQVYDAPHLSTHCIVHQNIRNFIISTGMVSALKKVPIRSGLPTTGEITIMGKVLPVEGIQHKVRAAYDAGVQAALLQADNLKEAEKLPSHVLDGIKPTPVSTIDKVVEFSLGYVSTP